MTSDQMCIVLVSTRNPLNIGAAARAMLNFGFQDLRVVNAYPIAFRDARSAVGASQVLLQAKEFKTIAEAVADCSLIVGTTDVAYRHLQHPLHVLKTGAELIKLQATSHTAPRAAILFGSEKSGLSNEDMSHCHWLMHIPTSSEQKSMNLGQAVAVCLYELVRESPAVPSSHIPAPATSETVERVLDILLQVLHTAGYIDAPSVAKRELFRRLLRRMQFSQKDALTWLGILRQILWKLHA